MIHKGDAVQVRVDEKGQTRWVSGVVHDVKETGQYILDELQVFIWVDTDEGRKMTTSYYGVRPL
jgi:hypothetical protein